MERIFPKGINPNTGERRKIAKSEYVKIRNSYMEKKSQNKSKRQ